jgi:hypothetical protein
MDREHIAMSNPAVQSYSGPLRALIGEYIDVPEQSSPSTAELVDLLVAAGAPRSVREKVAQIHAAHIMNS